MINNVLHIRIICCFAILFFLQCRPSGTVKGAVVSARIEASKIGIDIMESGGNAFDAAVAVGFALSVCYPFAGNLAGGGFMVYRNNNGKVGTLDFREKAPWKAHRTMYLDSLGEVIPNLSTKGGLAVGVPGTVAGLEEIHKKFGLLEWEQVIQPAIELAKSGFKLTKKQTKTLKHYQDQIIETNGATTFYGQKLKPGKKIRNQQLAQTLERIKKNGKDGFYKGSTAEALLARIKETGGIINQLDLDLYRAVWRSPITFNYDDLTIYSMGPPSSGGICLGQIMKMIEPYPIDQYGHNTLKTMQIMIEAERRSFADRSHFLGDSDYVEVPIDSLLNEDYLTDRMKDMSFEQATQSEKIRPGILNAYESLETTHYSILDPEGNAVSITTTLNGAYGSKVYVEELGIFLNNEMDDFSSRPGSPNMFGLIGGEANAIEPQKRMLSAMTPTIVERKGNLFLIVGTPGGPTIITSVLQTILNVHKHGMSIQKAVDAPRFHHQWLPDIVVLEPELFDPKIRDSLTNRGYNVSEEYTRIMGRVDAIHVDAQGNISTGADTRGDDKATLLRIKQ